MGRAWRQRKLSRAAPAPLSLLLPAKFLRRKKGRGKQNSIFVSSSAALLLCACCFFISLDVDYRGKCSSSFNSKRGHDMWSKDLRPEIRGKARASVIVSSEEEPPALLTVRYNMVKHRHDLGCVPAHPFCKLWAEVALFQRLGGGSSPMWRTERWGDRHDPTPAKLRLCTLFRLLTPSIAILYLLFALKLLSDVDSGLLNGLKHAHSRLCLSSSKNGVKGFMALYAGIYPYPLNELYPSRESTSTTQRINFSDTVTGGSGNVSRSLTSRVMITYLRASVHVQ